MPTASDALRGARAYLLRVAEPPAPALVAFVAAHGPIEAAARVATGDVPSPVGQETSAHRHHDLVETDLAAAHRAGARLVVPEDDEWPTQLADLTTISRGGGHTIARDTDPPHALLLR